MLISHHWQYVNSNRAEESLRQRRRCHVWGLDNAIKDSRPDKYAYTSNKRLRGRKENAELRPKSSGNIIRCEVAA